MRISIDAQRTADQMTCAISRLLQDGERVFQGVSSHLPMVAIMLAKNNHAKHIVHLNISGGVNPSSCRTDFYSSAGPELYEASSSYFPLSDVFDLSMRGGLDVAFLSGVQFDASGNVNASVIGDYHKPKVRLPGGAGSAVLIPTAKRVILWRTKHDTRTFVSVPDFVTARGNAWRLVTPLCVFAFVNGRWELDSLHPGVTQEQVRSRTGFETVCGNATEAPPPTDVEMNILRRIDPKNLRALEFLE